MLPVHGMEPSRASQSTGERERGREGGRREGGRGGGRELAIQLYSGEVVISYQSFFRVQRSAVLVAQRRGQGWTWR